MRLTVPIGSESSIDSSQSTARTKERTPRTRAAKRTARMRGTKVGGLGRGRG
jgi:hypothetical protein